MSWDLITLRNWLLEVGCTHVRMESMEVYWRTVHDHLYGFFEIVVVNAQHIKVVPGRKTDVQDAEWIADLLQHGLLMHLLDSARSFTIISRPLPIEQTPRLDFDEAMRSGSSRIGLLALP
jgi:hypothetical protein